MGGRTVFREAGFGVHHLQPSTGIRNRADLRSAVGEQPGRRLLPGVRRRARKQHLALPRSVPAAVLQRPGGQSKRRRVQRQQPQRTQTKGDLRRRPLQVPGCSHAHGRGPGVRGKAAFADRGLTGHADVYYIKWTNIQQVLSLTCGYPYNTNAGNSKSYGPELEISALVAPGLTLDLSGTYNTAEI